MIIRGYGSGDRANVLGTALKVDASGGYGVAVTPTVSSTPQAHKDLDAGSSQFALGFRATAGAGDDTVASNRLANIFPAVAQSGLDSTVSMSLDTGVTRVDVVGIGTATAGGCMDTSGSVANALAQMTTFEFSIPVTKIVITITGSWNSGREAQITVEGYYNA